MVKLTEVEDEHFVEKPTPSKNDALLVSDDEDDYSDTGKCQRHSILMVTRSHRVPRTESH